MANRSILAEAIFAFATLTMITSVFGQQAKPDATRDDAIASTGIRTERLSPGQLQAWRSIEQIIQAVDRTGKPLHPKLFSLWRWAQTSGHPICLEIVDEKNPPTYHAGFLTVQATSGNGAGRTAVIQLWSWIIEKAPVQKEAQRPDGFIPFAGLGKLQRYAQVFGHELVHAFLQLNDPAYDRLCASLETERTTFLSSRQQSPKASTYDQAAKDQLARIKSLTEQIEKPAQSAEVEIWRELLDGQRPSAAGG